MPEIFGEQPLRIHDLVAEQTQPQETFTFDPTKELTSLEWWLINFVAESMSNRGAIGLELALILAITEIDPNHPITEVVHEYKDQFLDLLHPLPGLRRRSRVLLRSNQTIDADEKVLLLLKRAGIEDLELEDEMRREVTMQMEDFLKDEPISFPHYRLKRLDSVIELFPDLRPRKGVVRLEHLTDPNDIDNMNMLLSYSAQVKRVFPELFASYIAQRPGWQEEFTQRFQVIKAAAHEFKDGYFDRNTITPVTIDDLSEMGVVLVRAAADLTTIGRNETQLNVESATLPEQRKF